MSRNLVEARPFSASWPTSQDFPGIEAAVPQPAGLNATRYALIKPMDFHWLAFPAQMLNELSWLTTWGWVETW
jgi:hypothetical protein